jgi:hypothetical protein
MRVSILVLLATIVAACNVNQELPLNVVVYPSQQRCTVKQGEKEDAVDCAQLGVQLRDVLKISLERQIDVSLTGSENVSKDDKSIDRIAEVIRAAGFKDVRTYRFGM